MTTKWTKEYTQKAIYAAHLLEPPAGEELSSACKEILKLQKVNSTLLYACEQALIRWGIHCCEEVKLLADAIVEAHKATTPKRRRKFLSDMSEEIMNNASQERDKYNSDGTADNTLPDIIKRELWNK